MAFNQIRHTFSSETILKPRGTESTFKGNQRYLKEIMATELQRRAVELALENIGLKRPLTKQQILLKAGYSKAIAKNPDIVWDSIGFNELIDGAMPDDLLAKKHREGLDATSLFGKDGIEHPDYGARYRYLEGAYKLKGKLKDGESNKTLVLIVSGESAIRYNVAPPNSSTSSN